MFFSSARNQVSRPYNKTDKPGYIFVDFNFYQWRVLVNTVMYLWVPQNVGKFLSSCTIFDFSRRPAP
jgi:hypothetical protein